MDNKKIKICIIVSVSVLVLIVIGGFVNDWIWKKKEAEKATNVMYWKNEGYIYVLHIEGEFSYTPNTVEVKNMQVDERELLIDVVLYNEYHKGEELTVEQLLEEYDNFCNNRGSIEGLDAFRNFDRAEQYDAQEHPLYLYNGWINDYIQETFGFDNMSQVSLEQLEEAAEYAAKQWHEYPGEY